jgi:two-component system, OmpR family, sensor histidine kinase KdpD
VDTTRALASAAAVAAITVAYTRWLDVTNATTVALTYLLVVLVVAATSRLWVAVMTSLLAMVCINFFFLPPVGTLTIADPRNWVALVAFLAVSLVASNLSSVARARTAEALGRRDEVARLFDLSRDILLLTDSDEAIAPLANLIARRFDLDYVAISLPQGDAWRVAEGGSLMLTLDTSRLGDAMASVGVHTTVEIDGHTLRLVPLRFGARAVGVLATAGRPIEPGTLDALGGIAAIAVERAQFLEERKSAEVSRRSEALKSALLASLAHDLRTPLTAIRVAATNLQASWPNDADRREQSALVLNEVGRLTHLFQNILEMARIDAGSVGTEFRWVHPAEIIAAARDQVGDALDGHALRVDADSDRLVRVDPRLTATALAHLLENAAHYAPAGSPVEIASAVTGEGLEVRVRDRGPGIAAADLPHIFERFYRGAEAKSYASGTGMGLSIARGLLAAEGGRILAENCSPTDGGGARFIVVVPAETRGVVSTAHVEQAS